MLVLISMLMLTALFLQFFCFVYLIKTDAPSPQPARDYDAEDVEEKKTKLGRPIRIVEITDE